MRKHYTPEIEEFHVGFEYEAKQFLTTITHPHDMDNVKSRWVKCKWSNLVDFKDVFNVLYEYGVLTDVSVPDCVRVNHLDREDIESLGFSQSNLSDSVFLYKEKVSILPHLPKTTVGLNFNEGIPHVLIYYVPDEKAVPAGVNLFVGKIKNKSELKRLLKQLGIW